MDFHVLHHVDCWLPQTEVWLYEQVKELPSGIVAHIACDTTTNLDQFRLPRLHDLGQPDRHRSVKVRIAERLGFPLPPREWVRLARQTGVSILHSHFGHVGWRDLPLARRAGLKHIVTFYGYDVGVVPNWHPRWRGRYRELFDGADLILCEGPHMATRIVALGCPPAKVRVHHLGVRVEDFAYEPRKWKPGEPLRVLIAASFREKKGIPYAMEALGSLSRSLPLEITVIGDAGADAPGQAEKARILEAVARHRLEGVTRFLGYVPHATLLEEAYRHHVFLSPSVTAGSGDDEGGAPVSIIDMMATGLLVVSTRHCDIPNLVIDGHTGLLAEERDADGLVAHLRWLTGNVDRWPELAAAARRRAEEHFDARVQGRRLAELYREVVSGRPASLRSAGPWRSRRLRQTRPSRAARPAPPPP